jgi:hypothetical protein
MAKRRPWKRSVRWIDRALVGAFMGTAAFVTERVVLRRLRQKTRSRSTG